ncbi:hypothetical protein V1522DRAFT_282612 [Lipomyces starkeyi]
MTVSAILRSDKCGRCPSLLIDALSRVRFAVGGLSDSTVNRIPYRITSRVVDHSNANCSIQACRCLVITTGSWGSVSWIYPNISRYASVQNRSRSRLRPIVSPVRTAIRHAGPIPIR